MTAIDTSLQAIQTAFSQLDQTAKRIASVADPASSDKVDLSVEMVNLLSEKNQVATSVKAVQTVDEMQTNLLNILA
jgi:flagellar hook protein FlgE